MSEYQYYEFLAIDRPLDKNEMAERMHTTDAFAARLVLLRDRQVKKPSFIDRLDRAGLSGRR